MRTWGAHQSILLFFLPDNPVWTGRTGPWLLLLLRSSEIPAVGTGEACLFWGAGWEEEEVAALGLNATAGFSRFVPLVFSGGGVLRRGVSAVWSLNTPHSNP